MIAFMFPGQGSQKRGMGERLFDEVREYAVLEPQIDAIAGYSMRKLCLQDPEDRLRKTQYTQPGLYVVNALYYFNAMARGVRPSFVAGHSLGEYNALLAAGVFDFPTGLRLVKKRGELMAHAHSGGMAAIIGLGAAQTDGVLRDNGLTGIDVANYNSPCQIVVSGPREELRRAAPLFEAAGARMYLQLPVSAAFHSRYVADAARAFADFIRPISFDVPKIPVIANVTAEPYPTANTPDALKDLLVRQITSPVLWARSIQHLLARGVTDLREMGPGNVLTNLLQQIREERRSGNQQLRN